MICIKQIENFSKSLCCCYINQSITKIEYMFRRTLALYMIRSIHSFFSSLYEYYKIWIFESYSFFVLYDNVKRVKRPIRIHTVSCFYLCALSWANSLWMCVKENAKDTLPIFRLTTVSSKKKRNCCSVPY